MARSSFIALCVVLALIIGLWVVGCGGTDDKYRYSRPEFSKDGQEVVSITSFVDKETFAIICGKDVNACAGTDGLVCEIYMKEECKDDNGLVTDPMCLTWLGHEFTHCLYGYWHGKEAAE